MEVDRLLDDPNTSPNLVRDLQQIIHERVLESLIERD